MTSHASWCLQGWGYRYRMERCEKARWRSLLRSWRYWSVCATEEKTTARKNKICVVCARVCSKNPAFWAHVWLCDCGRTRDPHSSWQVLKKNAAKQWMFSGCLEKKSHQAYYFGVFPIQFQGDFVELWQPYDRIHKMHPAFGWERRLFRSWQAEN